MTKITFYKNKNLITGLEVSGHTGKDDYGKDLLCAQISTVAQLAVVGIKEIAKANAFVEISNGYLKIKLSPKESDNEKIQFLFVTCLESFRSIIVDEKKFTKLEVKNDI